MIQLHVGVSGTKVQARVLPIIRSTPPRRPHPTIWRDAAATPQLEIVTIAQHFHVSIGGALIEQLSHATDSDTGGELWFGCQKIMEYIRLEDRIYYSDIVVVTICDSIFITYYFSFLFAAQN